MNRKDIQWQKIGEFENKSGIMDITDPCYDKGVWCRSSFNCEPGIYNAYVDVRTDKFRYTDNGVKKVCDDTRVYSLRIVHQEYEERKGYATVTAWRPRFEIGNIGVDAGLCGFFDTKPDYDDDAWSEMCGLVSDNDWAVLPYGAFSSSGYGDGCYACYTWKRHSDTLCVAAELRFI